MPPRMKIHRALLITFAIGGMSIPLSGQTSTAVSPDTIPKVEKPGPDPRFLSRVFPAIGMGAAGAFLGGLLTIGGLHSEGAGPFVVGLLAGGTLGSALGAAAPRGRGLCTENQRFWRALAGATLGLAAGVAIVREADHPVGLAAVPLGSVMFMTRC